jgi:hypothetical protein
LTQIPNKSHQNIERDLQNRFTKIVNDQSLSEKSNFPADSLPNDNNPYDYVGKKHNEVLRFVRSQSKTDLGELIKDVKTEFSQTDMWSDFDSTDIVTTVNYGISLSFDSQNNFDDDIYDTLLSNSSITSSEKAVLESTANAVFNENDFSKRIALIKSAEDYTKDLSGISDESKRKLLSSLSIKRWSAYYWEIEERINLACPACVSYVDDSAAIWASTNNVFNSGSASENWDNIWGFAGLASQVAAISHNW